MSRSHSRTDASANERRINLMSDEVPFRSAEDCPAFVKAMADTLACGREFAVWIADGAGDERLAFSIRLDAGAYRIRDADLSDRGAFADAVAAMRFGHSLIEVEP